jgi:putative hydrolase of the HAD superfamily
MASSPYLGLTLDLDDTLWPVQVTIRRAEQALLDWLGRYAPRTTVLRDAEAALGLRRQLLRQHPEWRHDLSRLRLELLRAALSASGDDPALAEPAFEVFLAERQNVELFDDALPALARLASRYPVWALTNGNADVGRIGLAGYFAGAVSARDAGVMKPEPRIFELACESMGLEPDQVLHVGDDWAMDVRGARGAGLHAAWVNRQGLDRPDPSPEVDAGVLQVGDLLALCDQLGC